MLGVIRKLGSFLLIGASALLDLSIALGLYAPALVVLATKLRTGAGCVVATAVGCSGGCDGAGIAL